MQLEDASLPVREWWIYSYAAGLALVTVAAIGEWALMAVVGTLGMLPLTFTAFRVLGRWARRG